MLIYGQEPVLLDTRCRVLRIAGFTADTTKTVPEVEAKLVSDSAYGLLIVCNTATDDDRKALRALADKAAIPVWQIDLLLRPADLIAKAATFCQASEEARDARRQVLGDGGAHSDDIGSLRLAARPVHDLEFHHVAFLEGLVAISLYGGVVNKHVGTTAVGDETIALGVIEPRDQTCVLRHSRSPFQVSEREGCDFMLYLALPDRHDERKAFSPEWLPPPPQARPTSFASGCSSVQGVASLLRRNARRGRVLQRGAFTCPPAWLPDGVAVRHVRASAPRAHARAPPAPVVIPTTLNVALRLDLQMVLLQNFADVG